MLRILHISDLHHRGPGDPDDWRRRLVLGDEWKRNLEAIEAVDCVCFTGDVAFSGKEVEFEPVTAFLEETLALLGVPWERFFVVPGNHDVDRAVAVAEYNAVRQWAYAERDPLHLSRYLAGATPHPPEGLGAACLDGLLSRRDAYQRWVTTTIGRRELAPSPDLHPRLGYRVRVPREEGGAVEFIGLDSAWLSGTDDEKKLLLTDDQLARLAPLPREPGVLRIGLVHHSFADLMDGRSARQLMAGRVDILLRGHLHRTESSHFVLDQDRGVAEFAVSSLFDGGSLDQYENGCQVITIHRDAPLAGVSWFRSWSRNRFWHSDNSLYAGTVDGRLEWILARGRAVLPHEAGAAAMAAYPRADYLRALRRHVSREGVSTGLMRPDRVYVPQRGRRIGVEAAEDEKMREAMGAVWSGDRRRVLVCGNYGMGKTYFALRTVLDQIDAFVDPSPRRLPIYFPLHRLDCAAALSRDLLQHRDVLVQILEYLRTLEFPPLSRSEFAELLAGGGAVVVLDGLDELKTHRSEWREILAPLLDLPGAACVLTSRTAYLEDKEPLLRDWDLYELQPWSPNEWTQYAYACAGEIGDVEAFLRLVAGRPRLQELTTRPLWCFMMVTVHQRLTDASDAGLADLYQSFLDETLERVMRSMQQQQILKPRQKFIALERFAVKCVQEQRSSLRDEVFRALVSRFLHDQQLSAIDDLLDRELKVYSFLNYDTGGYFSFGHASFESYFFASSIARDLMPRLAGTARGATDLRETTLAKSELSDETLIFLAGIVHSARVTQSLGIVPTAAAHADALANLEPFVRERLAHPGTGTALRRNLFLLLLRVRRIGEPRPALRRLVLKGVSMAGQDLSGCDFEDVDFTTARLQEVKFIGSSLRGCKFTAAAIDEADFSNADLAGADFTRVQRSSRPPRFTDAKNAGQAQLEPWLRESLVE